MKSPSSAGRPWGDSGVTRTASPKACLLDSLVRNGFRGFHPWSGSPFVVSKVVWRGCRDAKGGYLRRRGEGREGGEAGVRELRDFPCVQRESTSCGYLVHNPAGRRTSGDRISVHIALTGNPQHFHTVIHTLSPGCPHLVHKGERCCSDHSPERFRSRTTSTSLGTNRLTTGDNRGDNCG